MSFYSVPDEILWIIFNYCDTCDLIQLSTVCKRFYHITSVLLLKEKSNHLLVTGQMAEKCRKRCHRLISLFRLKLAIHYNWKHGIYVKKSFGPESPPTPEIYWNNLLMTKDLIWFSNINKFSSNLCAYERTEDGCLSDNCIIKNCKTAIFNIVPCNDVIVTNHGDGSISQWTIESLNGKKYFNEKLLRSSHSDNISFMDVTSQNIIAGSQNGEIKLWKYIPQENTIGEENMLLTYMQRDSLGFFGTRPIAFDPTGTKFSMCYSSPNSAHYYIYDIYKWCTEKYNTVKFYNSSVYCSTELLWEDSNTILLMGQKNIARLDIRTHKVVHMWNKYMHHSFSSLNCDERFTCISSDNLYAIMTGTSEGQVILWDQRQNTFFQKYTIVDDKFETYKYINNLQFDSGRMYAATYKLYEFDFTNIKCYNL